MTRPLVLALALSVALALPAVAAPATDVRATAAQAYQAGRYDAGIGALRTELARMPAGPSAARSEALFLLGRLEQVKGELALELARAGSRHTADHLARLAAGPTRLKYAPYYLGVARIETGDREGAASAFRQALRVIPAGAKGEEGITRQLAELRLQALQGRTAPPAGADPRVAAEAGFLLATAGRDPARGLAVAEAALAAAGKQAHAPPASVVRATAGARLAAGKLGDALALLETAAAHAPAAAERSGPLLTVEYYDLPVLRLVAEANLRSAVRDLEAAAADAAASPELRRAAALESARARLLLGDPKGALAALQGMPPAAEPRAGEAVRVKGLAARAQAALGNRAAASRLWQEALAAAGGTEADALGELAELVADARARGEADAATASAVLARGEALAGKLPGRLPRSLAGGLGLLTAATGGDAAAAVAQFERGRDKSAKNRLDANGPLFLARLAQQQVRARLFSEALEIYFEMGKTYPEVRQVQEALQGVYAAEQVAGGEVRIN